MTDEEYEEVRVRDRIAKQRAGYRCLGRLMARAAEANVPPILWQVAPSGVVLGEIVDHGDDPHGARTLFDRWVAHLGGTMTVDFENTTYNGQYWKIVTVAEAPGGVCGVGLRLSLDLRPANK